MIHDQVKKLLASGAASANRYTATFSGGGLNSQTGANGTAIGWATDMDAELRVLNEHSNFLVSSIQFPGRSFATGEMRGEMALGLNRKYVHSVLFNEFSMTYTLTGDMAVHNIFNQWVEKTATRVGDRPVNRKDMRLSYYNSYIDPKIILKKYERDDRVSLTTEVYNAFPLNVSDLSLSASNNSSTLEFTVNFAYETFENVYQGQSSEQTSGGGGATTGAASNAWTDADLNLDYSKYKYDPNLLSTDLKTVNTNWEAAFGAESTFVSGSSFGSSSGSSGSKVESKSDGSSAAPKT